MYVTYAILYHADSSSGLIVRPDHVSSIQQVQNVLCDSNIFVNKLSSAVVEGATKGQCGVQHAHVAGSDGSQ